MQNKATKKRVGDGSKAPSKDNKTKLSIVDCEYSLSVIEVVSDFDVRD